jgi:endonuclease YncB( thermonuclease family)
MFWRKKSDGFDWHKHIRTTIKLRREARRQKIDEVMDMAVGGIKGAGQAGVAASTSGLDALNRAIAAPFCWIGRGIAAGLEWTSTMLARATAPVGRMMERRGLAPMLGLVAGVTGLLGIARAHVDGWDAVALALGLVGLGLTLALVLPPIFAERGPAPVTGLAGRVGRGLKSMPGLGGISLPVQRGLTATTLVAFVALLGWLGPSWIGRLSHQAVSAIPGLSRPVIEGTATAVSGDMLRLAGQTIRLSGIEAPEVEQSCGGQGRGDARWRCGEAARNQLRDLVRGKQVRCELGSGGDRGLCRIGTQDIAAELVARGAVFSQAGLFSSYGRAEQDARNLKRGIWKGSAERPEEYRNRLWETAKKAAPQGCPIKGQITRNERVYHVPWAASYTRVRIRQDKGERWFCTEAEAQAAGFRRQGA